MASSFILVLENWRTGELLSNESYPVFNPEFLRADVFGKI